MGKKGGNRGVRIKQVGPKAPKGLLNPMDALSIPPEEMIHLPPPPDRSYQIFWPIHETFNMDPTKFIIIYPSYLDSTKTIAQGRRISKENAVPIPTVADMSQALQELGIRHVIQPYKGYSRDITTIWDNPGRIKVDPTKLEATPLMTNNETTNIKKCLLIELGQRIPTLNSRIQRLEQEAIAKQQKEKQEEEERIAAKKEQERARQLAAKAAQQQKQSSKTSNKKKGKKKR